MVDKITLGLKKIHVFLKILLPFKTDIHQLIHLKNKKNSNTVTHTLYIDTRHRPS